MIKVTVLYPATEGASFDHDYYRNSHIPAMEEHMGPLGLVRWEAERGIGTAEPGAPAPYVAIGCMYFETLEQVQAAFGAAEDLRADIPNYTDIDPVFQIGEVVE